MDQIKKNTVSAENQLREEEYISYINQNGKGKHVLFVGNSITRHGYAPEIGWNHDFGMAATSIDKDYVHLTSKRILEEYPDAAICICQAAVWEQNYKNGEDLLYMFKPAQEFNADIIIFRLIENCKIDDFEPNIFYKEFNKFIKYINPNNAELIFTSSFWKHTGDVDIEKIAGELESDFIYLGDLGEDDDMKAIGLFEHSGVANHPGDMGMQTISDRICDAMFK